MPNIAAVWKTDLFPFVGQQFDLNLRAMKSKNELVSLFGEKDTNSAFYELRSSGDFPELPDYDGKLNELNPRRAFSEVIRPRQKQGTYRIEYQDWLNDMTGEVKRAGKYLAASAHRAINNRVLRKFASAFDATILGCDGQPWASTTHPNGSKGTKENSRFYEPDPSLGTFSNLFNEELTVAAIDKLIAAAARFETPSGEGWDGDYSILLVPPELAGRAKEICGINAELTPKRNPDNAENAANPVYGLKYIVCGKASAERKLGFDKNQWALVDPEMFKEVTSIVYNTRPFVDKTIETTKLVKGFYSYVSLEVGHADARPILFSQF